MEKYYRDLLYELKFKLRTKITKFWSRNKNISQRLGSIDNKSNPVPSTTTKGGLRRETLCCYLVYYRPLRTPFPGVQVPPVRTAVGRYLIRCRVGLSLNSKPVRRVRDATAPPTAAWHPEAAAVVNNRRPPGVRARGSSVLRRIRRKKTYANFLPRARV